MKFSKLPVLLLGLLTVLALIAAACGNGDDDGAGASDSGSSGSQSDSSGSGPEAERVSGTVVISGSSTVEPISVRVAELFEDVQPDVAVSVDGPGTGDGFKLFCAGDTDISDASREIRQPEVEECAANGIEYVGLRVAIDGIAVMTSDNNDAVECISFEDIYALVGPESTGVGSWADAQALASELGSSSSLPDASLDLYGPGEESGTFDSFVEIVLEDIASERGQDGTTRPDYSANADDNVIIQGIQSSDSSLGWVGFAFTVSAGGVKLLEVDGGEGCVAATADTIASGEYPVSRSLYIYVNTTRAAENPALAAYVDFYMSDEGLGTAVSDVGYVNLTADARDETRANWAAAL